MYGIYHVTYQDINKEEPENILIQVNEDVEEIEPNIATQIYNYLHPEEIYQGEISIITMHKLYTTNNPTSHGVLNIKGGKS